ncbi:hypothetical protein QYE76_002689 [Lolium multiflorum]|uniref:Uncharacterized protein n=1 Tax=Lolium multiflorum TaxID=4521 RepID=A0AAD8RNU3_LOLMU|nr:hypothetical protein QYE76_002689 [Lolium multiflorum]
MFSRLRSVASPSGARVPSLSSLLLWDPALADPELHPPSIHLHRSCEAFLGIDPHWGLWKKIFYVKRHNDSNGPPVVGGVGFVVRKEVDYLDYPMKESVQGWRNKWFYLRDPSVSGRCSNLPPFEDKLIAKPKKSWQNTLSPDEKLTADRLFDQVVTLKNTGGLTMCGTRSSRVLTAPSAAVDVSPHQLWLYSLVLLTMLTILQPSYPPSPESGVDLEDDDEDSDGTEDARHVLEDSDVQGEEATEDDAFIRGRRRKQVHDDLIASAESSPHGSDNDADDAAAPPPAKKSSTSVFAGEDDLDLSDDDDDEVPLAKRAKFVSERAVSAKESNPSPAKSTPPSRTAVEKVPMSTVIPPGNVPASSAGRDHPIYATVDAVAEFAEEFTRLELENSQLRKTVRSSADQVLEANRLAADAKNENVLLKEEVKKLKQQLKDEQDAKHAAAALLDKKEGTLRESIKELLDSFIFFSCEPFPNPSSNDESSLVRRLRDQVSSLDKDITSLRAMAALVKKKGEMAIAIEHCSFRCG